ncbi:MAG: ketol-acid reductoisomerase [Candidatus Thorarchaeota archaeon]|jgi:ketol-acid reductoisomerase
MVDSKDIAKELKTPIYFDEDTDLGILKEPIAVIGYGNQGRAQALNLKDSGLKVIVGNIRDEYWDLAETDGFEVFETEEAAEKAKVILLLIPDELQPSIFEEQIKPVLNKDKVLCFASGYNITFETITVSKDFDTILVAPRMIGRGVRESFVNDKGFFSFIGVHNDASGKAKEIALAIAKGIGSTKPGGAVLEITFRQEAEMDLFNEQCFGPAFGQVLTCAVDVAIEAGYPPEVVLLELYMSGEFAYTVEMIAKMGTLKQLELHSPTSQYGSMSRGMRYASPELREAMQTSLTEIQDGSFAKEFTAEYELDLEILNEMKEMAQDLPIVFFDDAVRKKLRFRNEQEK